MRARTLLFAAFAVCAAAAAALAAIELPEGPNRALVYGQCRTCHDLQYLHDSAGISRDDWDQVLISMRQYGLRIPTEQRGKILDYLGTYLGPSPPPATSASASAAPSTPSGAASSTATAPDGAAVFKEQCVACHQANGQGVAGDFPPLAGNADLFLSRTFPALVVLFGLEGELKVAGKTYRSAMPPFAHLSDAEVAAVINYVRGAWGNNQLRPAKGQPLDAAAIAALRQPELTPVQVHAARGKLNAAAKQ
jgi:mono/diheme cytochrome c family protein